MGKSSKDKRDIYYRMAKVEGFRARSVYKLSQIFEETGIMRKYTEDEMKAYLSSRGCALCATQIHDSATDLNFCTKIIDLCSAPGSWSQYVSEHVMEQYNQLLGVAKSLTKCDGEICPTLLKYISKPLIVSVDMQDMAPIPNVKFIRGDITDSKVLDEVLHHFSSDSEGPGVKADIVLCDGAPDVTGLHEIDGFIQSELIRFSLYTATRVLRAGGTFISKIFRTEKYPLIASRISLIFDRVRVLKPSASRNSSVEAFIVAEGFKGTIENLSQMLMKPLASSSDRAGSDAVVPFIACGDLSSFDSDKNYPLGEYEYLEPIHPPITAPYLR